MTLLEQTERGFPLPSNKENANGLLVRSWHHIVMNKLSKTREPTLAKLAYFLFKIEDSVPISF